MKKEMKSIILGDKVYARICQGGRVILEVFYDKIHGLSELLMELRHMARRHKGLVQLYVRNISRGWSTEQPLMLYGSRR